MATPVQMNFKMPPTLKQELETKARAKGMTRSKYMRQLIMEDRQKSA